VTPENPTRRLFFALWPDDDVRAAIEVRRRPLEGLSKRIVPTHNLHATLVFLGNQLGERLPSIVSAAEDVGQTTGAFELLLDRFGWFARPRVVWLGGEAVAPGRALVSALRKKMASLEIELDPRPWNPHVTLFRSVNRRPSLREPEPLTWCVRSFALIESIPARPYQVLRTWSLE